MPALKHVAQILDLLSQGAPLRVSAVSRQLSIVKSVASRNLKSMAEIGLLEKVGKRGYAAGSRGLILGNLYAAKHPSVILVRELLDELTLDFGFNGYS